MPREGESAYKNPDDNPKGPWKLDPITAHNEYSADYKITKPNGVILSRPQGRYWAFSEESIKKKIEDKEIVWGEGDSYPMIKRFLSEVQDGLVPITIFNRKFAGDTSLSKKELDDILGFQGGFSYTKPTRLVKRLMQISCRPQDIVFDFFAGSGTTAHAVMELNAEDGGNRQSISVQLPEKLEENSEAYKAGYRTIVDITRARIEKVIAKLKAEHPEKTEGLACANFTLAPSNFKVWNSDISDPGAIRQQLDALQNTEKAPDEQIAMLTELLLKNGLGALGVHAISKPRKLACGITVHRVLREDDRYLWLCFEPYVEALRDEILSASPAQVIMLNSCFVGAQGDEQLSNLQLDLAAQDISLLVI